MASIGKRLVSFRDGEHITQDELDTDPKLGSSHQPVVRDEHADETR